MTQFATDDFGDLKIADNNLSLTTGKEERRQRLLQNLKTFLGEWFLNINVGVPYFQVIFEKGVSANLVGDTFKDAILNTEGIVELVEFSPPDLDVATRDLSVNFMVRDESGETITINEVVP